MWYWIGIVGTISEFRDHAKTDLHASNEYWNNFRASTSQIYHWSKKKESTLSDYAATSNYFFSIRTNTSACMKRWITCSYSLLKSVSAETLNYCKTDTICFVLGAWSEHFRFKWQQIWSRKQRRSRRINSKWADLRKNLDLNEWRWNNNACI